MAVAMKFDLGPDSKFRGYIGQGFEQRPLGINKCGQRLLLGCAVDTIAGGFQDLLFKLVVGII